MTISQPTRFLAVLVLAFFLSACSEKNHTSSGGGASSDAPAGSDDATTNPSSTGNSYAGTYKGTIKFTIKALLLEFNENSAVTIVVDDRGHYTINTDSGFSGSGSLNGDSFSYSRAGSIAESGISCSGTVGVKGKISGSSVNGTAFTESLSCNPDVGATISGTLSATKV